MVINKREGVEIGILDLYKAFTPVIASQLLSAYYIFLSHSKAQKDQRPDEEISNFLIVSGLIEKSVDSLDQIDAEQFLIQLKALEAKG